MDLNGSFKSQHNTVYSNRQQETIVSKPGSLNGTEVKIEYLTDCDVYILDHTSGVLVENCSNSRIRLGPVAGFCHLRNCSDCICSIAARDLNVKGCTDLTLFMYTANDPHIEQSKGLVIAPFNFAYPLQDKHFEKAGLNPSANLWSQITDHTANERAANWSLLPPRDFDLVQYELPTIGKPVDPVLKPKNYSGGKDQKFQMGARHNGMFRQQSPKMGSNAEDSIPDAVPEGAPVGLTEISLSPITFKNSSDRKEPRDTFNHHDETRHALTEMDPYELILVHYTRESEFLYDIPLPSGVISKSQLETTLLKASNLASSFHETIDLTLISGFAVLLLALFLSLAIILILIFVDLYDGGLGIQLALVTVSMIALLVFLGRKMMTVRSQGNTEMGKMLEIETRTMYSSLGIDLRGDLYTLEIVISTNQ